MMAVASANRAALGVLREGANESLEDVLGRVVIVTVDFLVLPDMLQSWIADVRTS